MIKRKSVNGLIVASLLLVLILGAFSTVQAAGPPDTRDGLNWGGRRLATLGATRVGPA